MLSVIALRVILPSATKLGVIMQCHYAQYHMLIFIMLNVVMGIHKLHVIQSVIMLSGIILSVIMQCHYAECHCA
jgi:hypothetical protein